MDASDERTLHRLEAFSDIVIGFSLAQLGAAEVFTKTMSLNASGALAFFASFAIVCSLWYFHHRLFQSVFVPRTLPIILNFAWLANVVLLVFVSVRSSADGFQSRSASLLYFGLYAIAYLILTVQTGIGLRGKQLPSALALLKVRRQFVTMGFWTIVFVAVLGLVQFMPWSSALGRAIGLTFALGFVASVAMGFYFKRLRAAIADA